ncbi:MAG TPA: exopolysaccharide biosynthesis polyprenyl glycosylphosphotransferase [Rhizomicrobium sp.]|jgi:exopolysaccharide biosynthesis polyprenyl glycosylphosphotransferase|nr:exopolysaccharide biosynthesis polyprenyl glycosylphosphotransferase [Rhizomicrobium sp.]
MPEPAQESSWAAASESAPLRQPVAFRVVGNRAVTVSRVPIPLPLSSSRRNGKRLLDILLASILLVLLAPLLLAAAVAVRLESNGPALFRQWRLGLNGRPFRVLKLRTLTVVEDGDMITQVTRDDPRVTRLGRALRKLSLDELPQLINVLRGEMSLVGPRPHAIAHDHYYAERIENYALRQTVKPGLTGWAQIHGLRGETATLEDMRRRVGFDLWYVRRAGLRLDLRILFATPFAVLRGRNAW